MSKNPTRDDVHVAVDKLIQRQRVKLIREDQQIEWQTVPSLWEQLCTSTSWKGGGAAGGAFGSRPVIATGVVALRNEIEKFALSGADEITDVRENSPAGKLELADLAVNAAYEQAQLRKAELDMVVAHNPTYPTDDMTDDERAECIAAVVEYQAELVDCIAQAEEASQHLAGLSDKAEARRFNLIPDSLRVIASGCSPDIVDLAWWRETILSWVTQIRSNLALDPARPQFARNTACPMCHEKTSTTVRDGETVRTPAIAITWGGPDTDEHHSDDEWRVRAVECKACGATWWRGPEMERLVDQMMIAAATHPELRDTA